MRVAWDVDKADRNVRKHAVDFEEAATVFADPLALMTDDPGSPDNARIIGESAWSRLLLVVFVERGENILRLISARRATAHERRRYEEGHD